MSSAAIRPQRTLKDVNEVIKRITGRRPNRSPDNLELTRRLSKLVGVTENMKDMRYIHIAGTKGKGSTSALTAELLHAQGKKVGLFTSPHLVDVRERFQVNRQLIPEDRFCKYFFDIYERQEALEESPSLQDREMVTRSNFFRLMTVLAFHIFHEEGVDVAVMECGLGGRIDATNVISPVVCGITALGYDHMDLLGNTIEKIAEEKAGIMKAGVACFCSPQSSYPSTRKVLEKRARQEDCPIVFTDPDIMTFRNWPSMGMGGDHMIENGRLAIALSRYFEDHPLPLPLRTSEYLALQNTRLEGRSQVEKINQKASLYMDGAHTMESLTAALDWFLRVSKGNGRRKVIIFYSTRDTDTMVPVFLSKLRGGEFNQAVEKIILTHVVDPKQSYKSDDPSYEDKQRQLDYVERFRDVLNEVPVIPCAKPFQDLQELLDAADDVVPQDRGEAEEAERCRQLQEKGVDVLVTGSLYLVGDVMKLLMAARGQSH